MPLLFSVSTPAYLKPLELPAYSTCLILESNVEQSFVIESVLVSLAKEIDFAVSIRSGNWSAYKEFNGLLLHNAYELNFTTPKTKRVEIYLTCSKESVPYLYHFKFNGGEPCGSCEKEKADFALWQYRQKFGVWAYPKQEISFNLMFHVKQ